MPHPVQPAVTAFNELFQCKLTENELLDFAAEGG